MPTAIETDSPTTPALLEGISELLFVVLPLLILGIVVLLYREGTCRELFSSSEWSFAAAILLGQSLVKVAAGISKGTSPWTPAVIRVIFSALIVLGVMPSLAILALVLTTAKSQIATSLIAAQILSFLAGVGAFLWCAVTFRGAS
jgi:hypothetical protein